MHFSEVMAIALGPGEEKHKGWFSKHLINPVPLLKEKELYKRV